MILDATCGLKQMWFQKDAKDVIYLDMRNGKILYNEKWIEDRPYINNHFIIPTIQADNRYLPFKDDIFDLVLFDPPFIIEEIPTISIAQKYLTLHPITWTIDISKTIKELFRVLRHGGFLVFKWNETRKALKEALHLFPCKPLFGTNVSFTSRAATWWIVFRKD